MKIENEVEYKSVIAKEKYEELKGFFAQIAVKKDEYTQLNYYLDDKNQNLNKLGVTLRVRDKNGNFELTAKLPENKNGDTFSASKEINLDITPEEAHVILKNGLAKNHSLIKTVSKELSFTPEADFFVIGSLSTNRSDFLFYDDVISLDENFYNSRIDYEVEWETSNHAFVKYQLKKLGVVVNNAKGKRKRFLNTLKNK